MIADNDNDSVVPPSLPSGHLAIKRGLIEMVGELDRAIATLQASRAATLSTLVTIARREAAVALTDPAASGWHTDLESAHVRSTAAEVGLATRIPDRTVEQQMSHAWFVENQLPQTWSAWRNGNVSAAHVHIIDDHAQRLDDSDCLALFDEQVSAYACESTPARTRRYAARLVADIDPAGQADAHARSAARRNVELHPSDDGMSVLSAYLPSTVARAAFERITRLARSRDSSLGSADGNPSENDHSPGDTAFAARRADTLAELLLAGHVPDGSPNAAINAIRPRVAITIPALTLLGAGSEPAWLDGTCPIPLETARHLLSNAPDVLRIVTDPLTGMPLAADTYRTPRGLRRLIEHRQPVCVAPGCSIPSAECDIDHTREYAWGGRTDFGNLAPLCRRHHVLRHTTWRLERDAQGRPRWISPTGLRYTLRGDPDCPVPAIPPISIPPDDSDDPPPLSGAATGESPPF